MTEGIGFLPLSIMQIAWRNKRDFYRYRLLPTAPW